MKHSKQSIGWGMILALFLTTAVLIFGSCTTTKYVTVPEVHTEYVHHTDSVHQLDSIIREKETTIMQIDSATMAQYGIQLKAAERAWLIKTKELERELQRIAQMKADTIIQHDSIPYPVDKIVEVAKPLSWWQRLRLHLGNIMLVLIGAAVLYAAAKLYLKFHNPLS